MTLRGKKIVFASEDIPYGSRVLVRGMRASLAGDGFANAIAASGPRWLGDGEMIAAGRSFSVEMIEPHPDIDLRAIADGPIMDSNRLYLPAGKISMAEAREREKAQILPDSTAIRKLGSDARG